MVSPIRRPCETLFVILIIAAPWRVVAATDPSTADSDFEAVVTGRRNETPAETAIAFPDILPQLRANPRVTLHQRNIGEAQADVTLRGGIFENTGFNIGALTLFDPQTGHYTADIPVPPIFTTAPRVLTGLDNALLGFNSNVGTIALGFRPIDRQGRLAIGFGAPYLDWQHIYYGHALRAGQSTWGADIDLAHSQGDGTRDNAGHQTQRFAVRLQSRAANRQTDLLVSYQHKRYDWPFLYALRELHELIGSSGIERDETLTGLVVLNHAQQITDSTELEVTGSYRRHESDYELDIEQRGLFNDYVHDSDVWAGGLRFWHQSGAFALTATAQVLHDEMVSTSLTFGPFTSRTYAKVGLLPEITWAIAEESMLVARGGTTLDLSSHDETGICPLAEVALTLGREKELVQRYYLQLAYGSQVPGYTALGSNAESGLFRGNPHLTRERTRNLEAGAQWRWPHLRAEVAAFWRRDDDLVDWTFSSASQPFAARTANHVDIDTLGMEAVFVGHHGALEWSAAYTYLTKNDDYATPDIDASFYALNYPNHRAVVALVYHAPLGFSWHTDNELRWQSPSSLRRGRDWVVWSHAGVRWQPHRALELRATLRNLWGLSFQEVPGVPGSLRQASVGAAISW